jgi:transcriptional regulator with GAF, ATPase, and Fis domain
VKAAVESFSVHEIDRAVLGAITYGPTGETEGMTIVANWSDSGELQATPIGTQYTKEMLRSFSLFTSAEPLFFNDMLQDPRIDEVTLGIAKRANYRTLAALPLFIGPRQDGVLLLEGEQPHNFTQDEIRLLSALAPQISTVLENRRQFERAQQQANRESTLNVISQKIQSATTVEAVLQIAARELGHALGAPMTVAQLSMKDRS